MFDTTIVVVGTVLNTPEKRLLTKSNAVVTSFRVASHARRFNKDTKEWEDGAQFRIRVNCWRRLADHVVTSLNVGDPVIVHGRITTRDWVNEQGEPRITYEIDANEVGHDLARGTTVFTKVKADSYGTVVEDADRVNGEPTVDYTAIGEVEDFPYTAADEDALTILRNAGLDPSDPGDASDDDGEDLTEEEAMAGVGEGPGGSGVRGRRRGRQPVPA